MSTVASNVQYIRRQTRMRANDRVTLVSCSVTRLPPNDHVDRPRRANASQRSGPTCCYAARHSFTTTLAPCCFRPEAGDHDGCHNHDATGQATGQRGDECAVALEGRRYPCAWTDVPRCGDEAGKSNVGGTTAAQHPISRTPPVP